MSRFVALRTNASFQVPTSLSPSEGILPKLELVSPKHFAFLLFIDHICQPFEKVLRKAKRLGLGSLAWPSGKIGFWAGYFNRKNFLKIRSHINSPSGADALLVGM